MADILVPSAGTLSLKPLVRDKIFPYQAANWSASRLLGAKIEDHQGELFPRVGCIVTSMALTSRSVVRFDNRRGTTERSIKFVNNREEKLK